jgi:hypothetical protein
MGLPRALQAVLVLSWPIGAVTALALRAPAELRVEPVNPVPHSGHSSIPRVKWHSDSLVDRNPFRISRRPSHAVFGSQRAEVPAATPGLTLSLTGIIWSTSPAAVVSGIPAPGESRVMRLGDVVAGIRLSRIRPSEVVLVGPGDTWRLRLVDVRSRAP